MLMQSLAVRYRLFGSDKDDIALLVRKTKDEAFWHKGPDLFGREINHRAHLLTDEGFGCVVRRDLGRGFAYTDLCPEINPELIGRIACLRKDFRVDDRTDANINF